jgi:hypothetical protein
MLLIAEQHGHYFIIFLDELDHTKTPIGDFCFWFEKMVVEG